MAEQSLDLADSTLRRHVQSMIEICSAQRRGRARTARLGWRAHVEHQSPTWAQHPVADLGHDSSNCAFSRDETQVACVGDGDRTVDGARPRRQASRAPCTGVVVPNHGGMIPRWVATNALVELAEDGPELERVPQGGVLLLHDVIPLQRAVRKRGVTQPSVPPHATSRASEPIRTVQSRAATLEPQPSTKRERIVAGCRVLDHQAAAGLAGRKEQLRPSVIHGIGLDELAKRPWRES